MANTVTQIVSRSAQREAGRQRLKNTSVVSSSGALGEGDRGAFSFLPFNSGNPCNSQDYVYRWRQYVQMYETCWEARKIVRIIPEDALRKEWVTEDIPEQMVLFAKSKMIRLQFLQTLKKSLILERLLGGCLTFLGLDGAEEDLERPYRPLSDNHQIRFCNAIPVSRISRVDWCHDPLSEHYMRPEKYLINGADVHVSRCLVWDGEPLFDPYDFALTNFRSNLAGFGESKLSPLWDDVIKAVGTRQAAYQLIQTNNAIIMAVQDLQDIHGTKPGKQTVEKLKEIANNLSIYRAAMIDGDKINISQQSASFGSVPELMMSYLQILSAASDIPATRFIGQAPGGLNATGESDLENYYNVIDAYQQQRIIPNIRRLFDIILYPKFGQAWLKEREKLTIKFPPLWNESELEQSQRSTAVIDNVIKLIDRGLMGDEKAISELNAKDVLSVKLDKTDISIVDDIEGVHDMGNPSINPQTAITALKNSIYFSKYAGLIRAAGQNPDDYDINEFAAGLKEEQEHAGTVGGDEIKVAEIVLDHLREDPKYYAKLKKAGLIENKIDLPMLPEPTDSQILSGNYKKHHLKVHGLDIAVENPKGSWRRGIDTDGKRWKSKLPAHYGYIKKTEGADGDHVDVYIGPHEENELVFVVDQKDKDTNQFDEHKCIFGCLSMAQAVELYCAGFSDGKGKDRMGAITPVHVGQFKQWLKSGDTTKPYGEM